MPNMNKEISASLDFGDYCEIEQKRYGAPNEFYRYKVIGHSRSNYYHPVPVDANGNHKAYGDMCETVKVICCGVAEERVETFRFCDVRPLDAQGAEPVAYGLRSAISGEWDGKSFVKASDADLYDVSALLPLFTAPPAQAVRPSRDDIIQALLATQGQSEGVTADAIVALMGDTPVQGAELVAYADPQAFKNFKNGTATREWMWAKPDKGLSPLYTAPPAQAARTISALAERHIHGVCIEAGHRRHLEKTGEDCTCTKYFPGQPAQTAVPDELIKQIDGMAGNAYCRYIDKMQTQECLGYEAKLKSGKFGAKELIAHCEAHKLLGRHMALAEAGRLLNAAPAEKSGLTLENAPIGTRAPTQGSQSWLRTETGWQWGKHGRIDDKPGGGWTGELVAPAAPGNAE